ncbi:MAG: Translation initiation factor IF-2 [Chlamydiae bacterium]|nr:Translation initiation factor IF-2 [Chlamydiota bacterium]
MAKNLKLKVKNTQLAAALKKTKEKKEELAAPKKPVVKAPEQTKEAVVKVRAAPKKVEEKAAPSVPKAEAEAKTQVSPEPKRALPEKRAALGAVPKSKTIEPKQEKKAKPKAESLEDIRKREKEKTPQPEQKEGFKASFGRTARPPRKRQDSRFDARDRQGLRVGEERGWRRRRPRYKAPREIIEVVRPSELAIRIPISVKELAQAMKLKASELISKLFMQGIAITINDFLDDETTIQLLGHEFKCEITIDTTEEERLRITGKTIQEEIKETDSSKLVLRTPVVAFMGHVDHGKTSLIDVIRKSNIAGGEAGAITQHIGAFKCHREKGDLTILDTPGHEAFTLMRQRGTALTDIIVLVIAGDEEIKPQTDEAINLSKEAGVPLVVALNKCDKPGFDAENIHRQLADRDLLPEAWGGSVITIKCSATTGEGIPELLEMLILQSEILELRANPAARARGTVLESELHKGFGPIATLLVQNGTLEIGNSLVFEDFYARIKTMHDEHGKALTVAGPSTPVKITGLSGIPKAGCEFIVVENERAARKLTEERTSGAKRTSLQRDRGELESLLTRQQELSAKKVLNIVLRADVQGSVEAIRNSLLAIETEKVELNFISQAVGEISESDVELAAASNAVIIGFHTRVESHAEALIKRTKVVVKKRDIIYQIIDDITEMMLATLDKVRQENESGTAEIKQIFKASLLGSIAGCMVTDGIIKRNQFAKLIRGGEIIWEGAIASLKRVKEDVKEMGKGHECGILLERFSDYQVGDLIKTFEITYIQQEL